jgi:hypothetical protein
MRDGQIDLVSLSLRLIFDHEKATHLTIRSESVIDKFTPCSPSSTKDCPMNMAQASDKVSCVEGPVRLFGGTSDSKRVSMGYNYLAHSTKNSRLI